MTAVDILAVASVYVVLSFSSAEDLKIYGFKCFPGQSTYSMLEIPPVKRRGIVKNRLGTEIEHTSSAMAVVPYEQPLLSVFHENSRQLLIGDETYTIVQDWENSGVAAVVWDAVRI